MPKITNKGRYAFIDVYNTINTTEQLLSFSIDWEKLYRYLKQKWKCKEIFFYSGIDFGDTDTEQEYKDLRVLGYKMRTKTTIPYKRKDKQIRIRCGSCGTRNLKTIPMGYQKKSNCDVELAVDALDRVNSGSEILILTGDGDFTYLVKYLIDKRGATVYLVSNTSKTTTTNKRFSSRFKDLLKEDSVHFINIKDWKNIIKKEDVI